MSIKQIFLQQIENFVTELATIFPKSGDILLLKEKFFFIKSYNSVFIIEYFIQHIYPLKHQIIVKNEEFFLNGGGQEEIANDPHSLNFRDNIKRLWISDMSDENKEIMWKYFKTFIILTEKYVIENTNGSSFSSSAN